MTQGSRTVRMAMDKKTGVEGTGRSLRCRPPQAWPRARICARAYRALAAARRCHQYDDLETVVRRRREWQQCLFIGVCIDMCIGMCINMCIGMCIDMCVIMCIDMCIDMCADMCMVMCLDMCIEICIDMCINMCIDMCIDI